MLCLCRPDAIEPQQTSLSLLAKSALEEYVFCYVPVAQQDRATVS